MGAWVWYEIALVEQPARVAGLSHSSNSTAGSSIEAECVHIIKETKMAQKQNTRDKIAALKNQGLEDYLDGKENKSKPTGKKEKQK